MLDKILETEYSKKFDQLRKNRMLTSFYKYGPIEENYGNRLIDAIANLEKRLKLYKESGNLEFLAETILAVRLIPYQQQYIKKPGQRRFKKQVHYFIHKNIGK